MVPVFFLAAAAALGAEPPDAAVKTTDTARVFPEIATRQQWQERSRDIREQILVSGGLWPMPKKTPLHAVVSGKVLRDGYSVEKVYFQSWPGFYVAGNLYRPLGKGAGPFPAILNAHGHWDHGRLEDTDVCSNPGRCINFAKQGMIAFAYDMVGYNDTQFPDVPREEHFYKSHRGFASGDPSTQLWSVTLMGLQTWDSIRALDFLESLPDADKKRIACTGASGGGTQTFMLGAIDGRLAAQAPVVMVSHTMQGGCSCENMPGLRVKYSNMEIAAAAAPRPQILVSDTGDWTKTTMTMEGPALGRIYRLFNAPANLRYVRFDCGHNYNQSSRQAVYQWFDRWLLEQDDQPVAEQPFQKEPDTNLLVFPNGKLPPDAISQDGLIKYLIQMHRDELDAISPSSPSSLAAYRRVIEPAWKQTLEIEWPASGSARRQSESRKGDYILTEADVAREGGDEKIKLLCFSTAKSRAAAARKRDVIVLADPDGKTPFIDDAGQPAGLARLFIERGCEVVMAADAARPANSNQTSIFFTTYNRTRLQEGVRDLISICQGVRGMAGGGRVVLCGCGRAGLWSLLAAPAADAVIADCGQVSGYDDEALLEPDLFCPGLRNIDTFSGGAILAAPHPLVLHNVAQSFPASNLRASYRALRAERNLRLETHRLKDEEIVTAAIGR
ncbi:MAG TPA: acetylxylan esterase [Verrucomicrobiae bacterium]